MDSFLAPHRWGGAGGGGGRGGAGGGGRGGAGGGAGGGGRGGAGGGRGGRRGRGEGEGRGEEGGDVEGVCRWCCGEGRVWVLAGVVCCREIPLNLSPHLLLWEFPILAVLLRTK